MKEDVNRGLLQKRLKDFSGGTAQVSSKTDDDEVFITVNCGLRASHHRQGCNNYAFHSARSHLFVCLIIFRYKNIGGTVALYILCTCIQIPFIYI